jgi:hypothetical protein
MYKITDNGVLKTIETWSIFIPLHDNEGKPFDKSTIDSILQDISLNFPGFTIVNCIGFWKDSDQLYIDKNFQILIDALPSNIEDSSNFFNSLKEKLCALLCQEKIYVTKETTKEEFLTFDEFFNEVGLETYYTEDKTEKKRLAEQLVNRHDFILQRLGYETTVLHRDFDTQKIIWERKLCGITLKSILDDPLPKKLKIFAADQIDALGNALIGKEPFAIIGHYEFQSYVLEKIKYHPLIKTDIDESAIKDDFQYFSPSGKPLSVKRFVEEFTMTIFSHYITLREEGFLKEEIGITVGKDGSLQIGSNIYNNFMFHSPAIIPHQFIVDEIIRCLQKAKELYEKNELDPIAVLQAKAKNRYIFNRAILRKILKQKRKSQNSI